MTKAPRSTPHSTSTLPPQRPGGFSAAVRYGLLRLALVLGLGCVLSVVLGVLYDSGELAVYLLQRTALIGTLIGGSATLCRWVRGGAPDRLLSLHIDTGDWAILGVLTGMVVAGYLTERPAEDPDTRSGPLAIGKKLEIVGPTLDGGRFDLADYRGKVVLVDFWATWCGPCLGELPNLRATYDKYHAHGLEMVGISLDHERSALVEFLKDKPLPWPQIFFDGDQTQGFDNPLGRRYGIQAIPYSLLIDREGKLFARNLRGGQVEAAVEEALGQPTNRWEHLLAAGARVARWLFLGALAAPWWLLGLCGLGGAFGMALAGAGVQIAFRQARAAR